MAQPSSAHIATGTSLHKTIDVSLYHALWLFFPLYIVVVIVPR